MNRMHDIRRSTTQLFEENKSAKDILVTLVGDMYDISKYVHVNVVDA